MVKNYGLIGCGMMGIEHINNLNLLAGARVSVVYDVVPELAEKASKISGGANVVSSIAELCASPGLDAVVIASPNFLHIDHLEAVARNCSLPILCEKPLYTHSDQEARLQTLLDTYPAPIWVAMEYRYMPPIAKLIEQASIVTGGVKMLTMKEHRFAFLSKVGDWNRFNDNTGGTLVEKCCHFFDLMRLIMQSEPIRVMASAGQITNHLDENYNGKTPDIWDGGYALFDFANGGRAMLELCMFADGAKWNEEIGALGPNGKIECRLPGPSRFWPDNTGPMPHPDLTISPRSPKLPIKIDVPIDHELLIAGDHHGSTFYQHEKFLKVVNGTGAVEVSLEDGRKAVKMGLAAQKAASENKVVNLY